MIKCLKVAKEVIPEVSKGSLFQRALADRKKDCLKELELLVTMDS